MQTVEYLSKKALLEKGESRKQPISCYRIEEVKTCHGSLKAKARLRRLPGKQEICGSIPARKLLNIHSDQMELT